ncbi:glyoxylate/hydroxypyruvate reductase A-like [Brevipalpus obovatus]|uniref:glyoxylate/hydroxypyruvate reductase A-like n=1 Tax=Brevipalpus obovatus TaxID=246614 RepID=UPI003D9EBBF4
MSSKVIPIISQLSPEKLQSILSKMIPSREFRVLPFPGGKPGDFVRDAKLNDEVLSQIQDNEIIIADNMLIPEIAKKCPKCKWVQGTFAGLETTFPKYREFFKDGEKPDLIGTRFSGESFGKLIADYFLSYVIAVERKFISYRDNQSSKDWKLLRTIDTASDIRTIGDLTVAVLGLGSIGKIVAKQFSTLGSKVISYARTDKSPEELREAGVSYHTTDVEKALKDVDYILAILPHTPETAGLLNGKFKVCEKKPTFINCGRGSLIGADEIIKALDSNFISCAVLDVFEKEPLPSTSPLWTHPKVIITPHVSALTGSKPLAKLFKENYDLFMDKKPLKLAIDWSKDY